MAENNDGYFNVHKYTSPGAASTTAEGGSTAYVSPSDSMANIDGGAAMVVSFFHEPSGQDVFFKAFITTLNESYNSDWTEEQVYGRTDPIQLFKQTTRRITLGLKVPAETAGEAFDNLARVGKLTQFLYPSYKSLNGQTNTLSQGPILRMKVMNLIRKMGANWNMEDLARYGSDSDSSRGLMGIITSLSVNHNLETSDIGLLHHGHNTILSTMMEINIDFTVIHEDVLGWDDDSFSVESFPYGAITKSNKQLMDAAAKEAAEEAAAAELTVEYAWDRSADAGLPPGKGNPDAGGAPPPETAPAGADHAVANKASRAAGVAYYTSGKGHSIQVDVFKAMTAKSDWGDDKAHFQGARDRVEATGFDLSEYSKDVHGRPEAIYDATDYINDFVE
jgi:hypothetical protein